jgi:hypothetical protein
LVPKKRNLVSDLPATPFDTIESAQDYIDLLLEAIEETRHDVGSEIRLSGDHSDERRVQALRLVALNLDKLSCHVTKSRRICNDLRTLRRLLLGERKPVAEAEPESKIIGAA